MGQAVTGTISACCSSSDDSRRERQKIPEKPATQFIVPPTFSELIPHLPWPVDDAKSGWCRERPQILKVDLEDLSLVRQCPDLHPAWYQQTAYYVSFHPTSEPEERFGFPHEAPAAREEKLKDDKEKHDENDAQHKHHHRHKLQDLVTSTSKLAEKDASHKSAVAAAATVRFDEALELPGHYLHDRLAVYIWGRRSIHGYRAEEVILAGYCVLPLCDFSLHGKMHTWPVRDSGSHEAMGDIKLQYAVATTSTLVREPQVLDIKKTELTLRWKPPLNDFGSPILSYQVEILSLVGHAKDEHKHEDKSEKVKHKHHKHHKKNVNWEWEWVVSGYGILYPVHIVRELQPDTRYSLRITAINGAGMSEPYELEVKTAAGPVSDVGAAQVLIQTENARLQGSATSKSSSKAVTSASEERARPKPKLQRKKKSNSGSKL